MYTSVGGKRMRLKGTGIALCSSKNIMSVAVLWYLKASFWIE